MLEKIKQPIYKTKEKIMPRKSFYKPNGKSILMSIIVLGALIGIPAYFVMQAAGQ